MYPPVPIVPTPLSLELQFSSCDMNHAQGSHFNKSRRSGVCAKAITVQV